MDCDRLSRQHPLILVFGSDVKFGFKISFLKQILFWIGHCGSKRNTLSRWLFCGSEVYHMQDGDGISVRNTAIVNGSTLEISAFPAQSSPIIYQFTKYLQLLIWHCLKVMLAVTQLVWVKQNYHYTANSHWWQEQSNSISRRRIAS